jgi:AcrR family transcriptional regulator
MTQATTPNARTLNAARSREAVIDAALELFATKGFDNTTTEEIAARAGVSPRTFFRYFDTKDSVVFHRDYGFMRSFAAAYLEQPKSMSDYDALRAAMVAQAEGITALRSRIETYRAAVRSSPALVGLEHQHFDDHAKSITAAITARRPKVSPEDARALASIALALFQRALHRWIEGPPHVDLADLMGEEFDRARRLLA